MNARTCQLCGKPLGRLRVGAEGDFCSREHRSQYGLRLGMDRLEEANKVSSLMRRRENPRQLGTERLMRNSAGAARVFEVPKLLATPAAPAEISPVFSIAGKARMAREPQEYRPAPPARRSGMISVRRADSSGIRITARKNTPMLPGRKVSLPVKLVRARIAPLRPAPPAASPRHRQFDVLPHSKIRVELGRGPAILRQADALGTVSIHRAPGTRKVSTTPRNGNALRVSSGIGFRVPKARLRESASTPAVRSALVWPERPHSTTPARIARPAAPHLLGAGIPVPGARYPVGPGPNRAARFIQADLVGLPPRQPIDGAKPPAKFWEVAWNPADPKWSGSVPGPESSAGFARRNGAHLFELAMQANTIDAVRQLASAPIHVRESPVGYPHVGIHGTLAGAILSPGNLAGTPGRLALVDGGDSRVEREAGPAAAPVVTQLEDHFDNGWDNWTGGMADWLVNVAGARTGSLALFNPSMDLIDYDLEFLARIDHHSVTWVVRAANLNEYCRCTLTAAGGELEFSRSVVFEGTAEPVVTGAGRIAAKPKAAMTVRTRVDGETYTVSVEGKTMATWTDARLPIGGIGFMGAPEDRARLYWVRLSSTDSPAKENQKR